MEQIKNCKTCAHCEYKSSASFDHCILGGEYCSIMRKYPSSVCDANLSGWEPRTTFQTVMDYRFLIVFALIFGTILISSILN